MNLQASALTALDWCAASKGAGWTRLPCLFHCDDPTFFAPSLGELRQGASVLTEWTVKYKQSFHLGKKKTALLLSSAEGSKVPDGYPRLCMRPSPLAALAVPQGCCSGVAVTSSVMFSGRCCG